MYMYMYLSTCSYELGMSQIRIPTIFSMTGTGAYTKVGFGVHQIVMAHSVGYIQPTQHTTHIQCTQTDCRHCIWPLVYKGCTKCQWCWLTQTFQVIYFEEKKIIFSQGQNKSDIIFKQNEYHACIEMYVDILGHINLTYIKT